MTITKTRIGRDIILAETVEEYRKVWKEKPDKRGDIYLFEEILTMQKAGDAAGKVAVEVEKAKSIFLGALVDQVEKDFIYEEPKREIIDKRPQPAAVPSSGSGRRARSMAFKF